MPPPQCSLPARFIGYGIIVYRNLLSNMMLHHCGFWPTCSQYALDAVARYGAFRGSWIAIRRLLRCHPFSRGGVDPVV